MCVRAPVRKWLVTSHLWVQLQGKSGFKPVDSGVPYVRRTSRLQSQLDETLSALDEDLFQIRTHQKDLCDSSWCPQLEGNQSGLPSRRVRSWDESSIWSSSDLVDVICYMFMHTFHYMCIEYIYTFHDSISLITYVIYIRNICVNIAYIPLTWCSCSSDWSHPNDQPSVRVLEQWRSHCWGKATQGPVWWTCHSWGWFGSEDLMLLMVQCEGSQKMSGSSAKSLRCCWDQSSKSAKLTQKPQVGSRSRALASFWRCYQEAVNKNSQYAHLLFMGRWC